MKKKQYVAQLKAELKELAINIRKSKSTRKSVPYGYVSGLDYDRFMARYKHVLYCLLRGRKYEEIENSTCEKYSFLETIKKEVATYEDVCDSPEGSEQESKDSSSMPCSS